jgi:hypothetical protein
MELIVAEGTLLAATTRIELAPDAAPARQTCPLGGWPPVLVRLR